jgi:3-hydroxyisobutyrate dehydrogenase-like beta-hydroxyacid dehydrogenase
MRMSDAPSPLGYIGLGNMGAPIADRLLTANVPLAMWARRANTLESWTKRSVVPVATPAALAQSCETILVCVTDADAVESIVFGPDGIAAGARPGTLLVDHSSIDPFRTRDLADRLAPTGMRWVDAPVSGGAVGARSGTLAVMAGGDPADVATLSVIARPYAGRVTHMGPVGAGQAAKACNQMVIGAEVAVWAEALGMAAKFGMRASQFPEALSGGWADSAVLQDHVKRMTAADFGVSRSTAIMRKDIQAALDLARATGAELPVTELVMALYQKIVDSGDETGGQISLVRLYADGPLD